MKVDICAFILKFAIKISCLICTFAGPKQWVKKILKAGIAFTQVQQIYMYIRFLREVFYTSITHHLLEKINYN